METKFTKNTILEDKTTFEVEIENYKNNNTDLSMNRFILNVTRFE